MADNVFDPTQLPPELAAVYDRYRDTPGLLWKAPNGELSALSPEQWLLVRSPDFKAWFGDWEKIERIKASKSIEITGREISHSIDFSIFKKEALKYGKGLRASYTNKDTGNNIPVTRGSITEILAHNYKDLVHLQSIAAIPKIIESAIYISERANEDKNKHPDIEKYQYYVCGLTINKIDFTVKAIIAVDRFNNRYYDHRLTQIEKGRLLSTIKAMSTPSEESNQALSALQDKRLLQILQEEIANISKNIDPNGEPLIEGGFFVDSRSGKRIPVNSAFQEPQSGISIKPMEDTMADNISVQNGTEGPSFDLREESGYEPVGGEALFDSPEAAQAAAEPDLEQTAQAQQAEPETQEANPLDTKEAALLALVRKDGLTLRDIPEADQTSALCMAAVAQNGLALQYVKDKALRTEELLAAAVSSNPAALETLSKDEQTPAVCMASVEAYPPALSLISKDKRTSEVCLAAVKRNGPAIQFAPEEVLKEHPEIAEAAIAENASAIRHIPKALLTGELCGAAFEKDAQIIPLIPEDRRTAEMCAIAVRQGGHYLAYTPAKIQAEYPELAEAAIAENGLNLKYAEAQTEALCILAVKEKPLALEYAAKKTPEICLEAVRRKPDALEFLFPPPPAAGSWREGGNTAADFEANTKLVAREQNFDTRTAGRILYAAMNGEEKRRLDEYLARESGTTGLDSIPALFEKWDKEIARTKTREAAQEEFIAHLGTEAFYAYPDRKAKERYYQQHLEAAAKAGYKPPVFRLADERLGVDTGKQEGILNPFSAADIEQMKAAAAVGVVFTDPEQKEKQLAFMKEHLPEVYAVAAKTLGLKPEQALTIGILSNDKPQQPAKKQNSPSYER